MNGKEQRELMMFTIRRDEQEKKDLERKLLGYKIEVILNIIIAMVYIVGLSFFSGIGVFAIAYCSKYELMESVILGLLTGLIVVFTGLTQYVPKVINDSINKKIADIKRQLKKYE